MSVDSRTTRTRPQAFRRTPVNPWTWQEAMGYSQGIRVCAVSETLYVSGQCSIDASGAVAHVGDMAGQLSQALDNTATVLQQAGFTFADVVRYDVYTTDVDAYFAASHLVHARFGGSAPVGGILCQVARLALPPLMVELVSTAVH